MAISRLAKRGRASNEKPDKLFDNWFATLIFCSITFIPTYILYFHKHSPEGALIFGCFALLALAQLLYAIRESMDLYKYGEVRYAESMTPTLGGELTGEVLLTRVTTGSGSKILHAELQCFQITFSANSKGRTTRHRKRVWYGEGKFRVRRLARVASAEIRIPIPYREGTESGISHEWELQVQMNVVGIDLIRTFPIEVRKGAAPVARPSGSSGSTSLALPPTSIEK